MIIVQCTLQSYFELNHIRRFVPPQEMEPETKEAYQPQVPACSGASMGEKNRLRFFSLNSLNVIQMKQIYSANEKSTKL